MVEYLSQSFSIGGALGGLAILFFYKSRLEAKIKGLQFQIDQLKQQEKETKDS